MGDTMQQRLTQDLTQFLASLPEDDRIKAINEIRMAIHQVSPFREEPVDCVLWVKNSQLMPNDYNPNNVAPPEKKLLQKSIEIDGFTQPIVVTHPDKNAMKSWMVFTSGPLGRYSRCLSASGTGCRRPRPRCRWCGSRTFDRRPRRGRSAQSRPGPACRSPGGG